MADPPSSAPGPGAATRPDPWQIWIDMGGTFTDCLARDPGGRLQRLKVLSSAALRGRVKDARAPDRLQVEGHWPRLPEDFLRGFAFHLLDSTAPAVMVAAHEPRDGSLRLGSPLTEPPAPGASFEVRSPEEAPLLAVRLVTGTAVDQPLPPMALRLATTLGTNALLQRRGAPTALFVTRGFADLLRIGTQQRPELFALQICKPAPLHQQVVEVSERLDAAGQVLRPLELEPLRRQARRLLRQGTCSAAVALAHSYRNPDHERQVCRLLREEGFLQVSSSARLAPLINLLIRAETAVVDAYLAPLMNNFLDRLQRSQGQGRLLVMTSAGGMQRAGDFRAKDSLLSGPAGGVVGAAEAARWSGFTRLLTFDMGGTSTDVARHDGDFDYRFSQQVGDAHLASAALAIETVAAGGGSICSGTRGELAVGPQSAGAVPGPACYGAGGPLTLTDVNLLLGRLRQQAFGIPVQRRLADRAAERVRQDWLAAHPGQQMTSEELLEGLLEIANARMADAIRKVSIRRGYDPAEHALVAFGGAGPQHACAVARSLGIHTIVVPRDAGLLSALGVGHARVERFAERQVLRPLQQVQGKLQRWLEQLARQATEAVVAHGVPAHEVQLRRRLVHLRFVGQDHTIQLDWNPGRPFDELGQAFHQRHLELYGHHPRDRPLELESLRVIASACAPAAAGDEHPDPCAVAAPEQRQVRFQGRWCEVPCYRREALRPDQNLEVPALVLDGGCTTVIEPGWRAVLDPAGALLLTREPAAGDTEARGAARHAAVQQELFVGRLEGIAREMGEVLQRTAMSTNIKERRDFSCAILDAAGRLVVNAPHIPVHLGSLGICARRTCQALTLEPGDVVVTNHPAMGGSHLPDITVLTPVFHREQLLGIVANRAHHAELGGICPGSMPPSAGSLAEEGVVIPPTHLVRAGRARWEALRQLLQQGPWPSRATDDNLADLRAAVAANNLGAVALRDLARVHGAQTVAGFMEALRDRAKRYMRQALREIQPGCYEARTRMDDGTRLCARVEVNGGHAELDFQGTAGVHEGNLNATPAVVRGVVIYLLRLLVRRPLPLNEGLMEAVTLKIPPGLLNPPFPTDPARCPAVVGGNVETSQRLVDLLLRALGLAACSQGTMNNLLFGNERFGYYETLGGGTGAGPGFDGASGVHSHMTNTRITDAEVLEQRFPVRVERFALRRGSGGQGRQRGGDGLVRELTFLQPVSLSVLSQRRSSGPCGGDGGERGKAGAQRVLRASGEQQTLGAIDGCQLQAGDRVLLETPGGGGWGKQE